MDGDEALKNPGEREQPVSLEALREVKARYEEMLMSKPNVVAVGIGMRQCGGQILPEPALVVNVTQKVALESLKPEERIPQELDGVPVDVQAIGTVRFF